MELFLVPRAATGHVLGFQPNEFARAPALWPCVKGQGLGRLILLRSWHKGRWPNSCGLSLTRAVWGLRQRWPTAFWGFLSTDAPKTCSKGSLQMGLSKTGGCPKLFLSGEHEVLNCRNWGVTQFSDTEAVMWRARIQQAVAPLAEQPHYWGRGRIVISSHLWFCYPPYQPVVVMWGPAIWPAVRWWFTRSSKSQEIWLLCQARSSYLPSCAEARIAGVMENVAMVGSMNQLWRCTIKVTIIFRGRGKIHKVGHVLSWSDLSLFLGGCCDVLPGNHFGERAIFLQQSEPQGWDLWPLTGGLLAAHANWSPGIAQ